MDTSAWVEFLRDTDSPACRAVDRLLDDDLGTCEPVIMELLAGARDDCHLHALRGLLARTTTVPVRRHHWEDAARVYRTCRTSGATIRSLVDCLVAAVAIEADIPILHHDRDYALLAAHTPLRTTT